jgi:alpha-N-arabinofuranosidase
MGRLRAQNGHPEPYNVRFWEIGNELYGRWQVFWTTPDGYLDRYLRFREAMMKVDPNIYVLACGYGNEPLSEWNMRLIEGARGKLKCITDHILTGGAVDVNTDPVELFHVFMGYATVLEERYSLLTNRALQLLNCNFSHTLSERLSPMASWRRGRCHHKTPFPKPFTLPPLPIWQSAWVISLN